VIAQKQTVRCPFVVRCPFGPLSVLSLAEKQTLLEMTDSAERLQFIVDALPRFRSEPENDE